MFTAVVLFSMIAFAVNPVNVNKNSTKKIKESRIDVKIIATTHTWEITCFSGPIKSIRYESGSFNDAMTFAGNICGGGFMMTRRDLTVTPSEPTSNLD